MRKPPGPVGGTQTEVDGQGVGGSEKAPMEAVAGVVAEVVVAEAPAPVTATTPTTPSRTTRVTP